MGEHSKNIKHFLNRDPSLNRGLSINDIELNVLNDEEKTGSTQDCKKHNNLPKIKENLSETGIVQFLINQCDDLSGALELFKLPEFKEKLSDSGNVLLIKFEIFDKNTQLDSSALFSLNLMCIKNSVVLTFTSKSNESYSLFWKSNKIQNFLEFKAYNDSYSESNMNLLNYIEKFLRNSLKNGHLGLNSNASAQRDLKQVQLHFLADTRDFNLMLLAAEEGDIEIVKILLKLGISPDSPFKDINAQSLAYQNRHFSVLLLLLQSNLTYPNSIDINECSDEIKTFHELSCKLHELVLVNNEAKVIKILDKNPYLRHFYNSKNESVATIALRAKNVDIYKILTQREVYFGPHEDTEDIIENLEYVQRRELRELHHEHAQILPERHLNVLISKSFIGHDVPDAKQKVGLLHHAFDVLNGIALIRTLLMVVAASKKFQIIFDFNRDSVQLVDPTATSLTAGIFYVTGRIYIGAKQLLNRMADSEALATLAHELCHYAVDMTFNNDAKPYQRNDHQSMQEFEKVSEHCRLHSEKEEVIEMVYDYYPEERHHAELIVRVPHLLALYYNQAEKLKEICQIFKPLFDFYEQQVAPEMEKAIPNIEASAEKEMREKDKKISNLTKIVVILTISSTVGLFIVWFAGHTPKYSFGTLSEDDKSKLKESFVVYNGVNVKFRDLFPSNSTAYNSLKSDDIAILLKGQKLKLDNSHSNHINMLIFHKWGNLTEKLKEKILNSNFTFQNESVKFRELNEVNSDIFNELSHQEIKQTLNGIKVEVSRMLPNDTTFYVERVFTKITDRDKNRKDYDYDFSYFGNTKYFKTNTSSVRHETTSGYYNENSTILNSDKVIKIANDTRLFVLSSEAGTGKTVVFKQLALKIKKKFPMRWVSYIDLKSNMNHYNTSSIVGSIEDLLANILKLGSKSKIEKKTFEEFYKSGRVVLVWNGFDEISPLYSDYIINVLNIIHAKTTNVQYLCTRPLYLDQLRTNLTNSVYKLIPLNDKGQQEFLQKFFNNKNNQIKSNSTDLLEKVKEIIDYLKGGDSNRDFDSPLMLVFVAETYSELGSINSLNVYEMYKIFIRKNVAIWLKKYDLTKETAADLVAKNIQEYYQKYALRSELSQVRGRDTLYTKLYNLNIMREKFSDFSPSEISRMGILFVNGEYEIDFAHRTFAEYFAVQYFIEKIYLEDRNINDKEAELRVSIFYFINTSFGRIKKELLKDFLKGQINMKKQNFNAQIAEALVKKFNRFFIKLTNLEDFGYLFEFFSKDRELFFDLLHINDDETFYTSLFNLNEFAPWLNIEDIKKLFKIYLTDEEYKKIIKGKNQRGKVIAGRLFYRLINAYYPQENIKITKIEEYEDELKMIGNLTYWDAIGVLKTFLTKDEQRELFKSISSPRIYMYFPKCFNLMEYRNLWLNFENLFTKNELRDLIGNAIERYLGIFKNNEESVNCLTFLLEKAWNILEDCQTHELFRNNHILHEAANSHSEEEFHILWEYYYNRTSRDERRNILNDTYEGDNYAFQPQYFKIIHRALISGNSNLLGFVHFIYLDHFSITEMQDIVLNPIDFLPNYISQFRKSKSTYFPTYLKFIYKGNEELLKKKLGQKIESARKNVFEFMANFPDDISSILGEFSDLTKL